MSFIMVCQLLNVTDGNLWIALNLLRAKQYAILVIDAHRLVSFQVAFKHFIV